MTNLTQWIGKQQTQDDVIEQGLVRRISATLGEKAPEQGKPLPYLWHWAFFQPTLPASELGVDGHPARGGFLPLADNRNRMWAGGRFIFHHPLIIGEQSKCISTIRKIEEKQGKTGALLFVTVEHDYRQLGKCCIVEEQDIVYREPSLPKLGAGEACPPEEWQEEIKPDPVMLFRYSAVTFNGHRIHYDYPYVTEQEGYPNIVIHGPLIATLTVKSFCRAHPEAVLTKYSYRSQRPLIHPANFKAAGCLISAGKAEVWAGNELGVAQKGEIEFQ